MGSSGSSGSSVDVDVRFPYTESTSGVDDVATALPRKSRSPAIAAPITADWLCAEYAGRVSKFARLVSEDSTTAEDLAQDALERAIKG